MHINYNEIDLSFFPLLDDRIYICPVLPFGNYVRLVKLILFG